MCYESVAWRVVDQEYGTAKKRHGREESAGKTNGNCKEGRLN